MRESRYSLLLVLVALTIAGVSQAQTITIDFESDTTGAKPNGFMSVDSAEVSFTDSMGADLQVNDFSPQSNGQGLAVYSDDPSYLIMDFTTPMQSITLWFGNDDPGFSNPGDEAVLAIFDGASQIDEVRVVMNRNDVIDQSISYSGATFDRATFFYDVSTNGLIEVVDDIELEPAGAVPTVPGWAIALLVALLAAGGILGLQRRVSV